MGTSTPRSFAPLRRRLRPARRYAHGVVHGTWPESLYQARFRRLIPEPRTFTEKLIFRMLFDRRPGLRVLADKVAARTYVADRVGAEHLPTLMQVGDAPSAIDWDRLPDEFVIKAAHASGGTLVIWRGADPRSHVPVAIGRRHLGQYAVTPDALARPAAERLVAVWLRTGYGGDPGPKKEWAYRGLPRRFLIEELLLDQHGQIPKDYKFFMFDGQFGLLQVDSDRFERHTRDLFGPDLEPLDAEFAFPRAPERPSLPHNMDRMLGLAKDLAAGWDFVRVDLYDLGERVVVGELTNYPEGGVGRFRPQAFDLELGQRWSLVESG